MTDPLRCHHAVPLDDWCALCEDEQLALHEADPLETRPYPDPHQAMAEARLRWTRGPIEVVTDARGCL